jgi:FAD/FMN-containing dehydrogenase/Fe-S oxidoreductase
MSELVALRGRRPLQADPGDSDLARRLRAEVEGDVLFDAASRGRYATDASIYQIAPIGVVVPRTEEAARVAIQIAAEQKVPILPRGAGTSQCGQTVGPGLIIDTSKHLNRLLELDVAGRRAWVQPGLVLDRLNEQLRPHNLFFPVDVSTSAQATIGGMSGNNSSGARSLRYGNMVHNVEAIDCALVTGERFRAGPVPADLAALGGPEIYRELCRQARAIWEREKDEIAARTPKVLRHVAGYNLEWLAPGRHNMARLLVGSEGTLAWFERIQIALAPVDPVKVLGVAHFPTFREAMEATKHIVGLGPTAVELVDHTMLDLARQNPAFRPTIEKFVAGDPDALLLVEFAGQDAAGATERLKRLSELMGDLGFAGGVVELSAPAAQRELWDLRKAGLNIMMSMRGDGKPVSFIEDCAVPLEHLADYTAALTQVFEKHGTRGVWYAHASVGCLHVRPILNMKGDGAAKMRAIAEEACALVKRYKGAYSGEHGDGLVRSEWIEPMLGARLTDVFAEIKHAFDPRGLMNPGKIVAPPRMDERRLFRYGPEYAALPIETGLDWSEWGGLTGAVEMCNNNGHCRKFDAGTMCPSYRATLDEVHLTRGRANVLRLALTGQLGPEALTSEAMHESMDLCISCKGCKRECPTGVDVARMKIEVLHQRGKRHGLRVRDLAIAFLPRYARLVAWLAPFLNLRNRIKPLAWLGELVAGISARRTLPTWRWRTFLGKRRGPSGAPTGVSPGPDREVVLLADTFNNWFEPENLEAALTVLRRAGYRVHIARPRVVDGGRPLCCGRTFLAVGLVEEARAEAQRMLAALQPFIARKIPIVGLEPSCLFTLRDEFLALLPGSETSALAAQALLFEEFLDREAVAGALSLPLAPLAKAVYLHGHCHQKAFDAMPAVERTLRLIPNLEVRPIVASCCGMAGSFGYEARHLAMSLKMAEMSLLPAVRAAPADALIVADGTSCRHQIHHGARREALHVARVLAAASEGR